MSLTMTAEGREMMRRAIELSAGRYSGKVGRKHSAQPPPPRSTKCARCRRPGTFSSSLCPDCTHLGMLELRPLAKLDHDGKTLAILEALRDPDARMAEIAKRLGVAPQRVSRVFRDRKFLPELLASWGVV